eukprot:TRINITY_DN15599_c0_g1_i1.p1 TRINITY_DN15599_c0_g1~~TRINITY_DN15599_c0_g1_i1.p1  ORF type:complete len:175 (+),score=37.48 TRINITY_DN15599_c0_g1_i1:77-526(+)
MSMAVDATYLADHNIPKILEDSLKEVLLQKPERPIQALIDNLQEKEGGLMKEAEQMLLGTWEQGEKVYRFGTEGHLSLETGVDKLECQFSVSRSASDIRWMNVKMLKYQKVINCIYQHQADGTINWEGSIGARPTEFTKHSVILRKREK